MCFRALLIPISLALSGIAPVHAADWHFTGYVKSFAVAQGEPDISGFVATDEIYQSQNALRLMLAGTFGGSASIELHYETKPLFASDAASTGLIGLDATTSSGSSDYRVWDINNEQVSDDGKTTLLQNLDRLNIRFESEHGDLTIGRQAIAFGAARFVSPTDIFEPFLVSTLDTEYRVGVDAVRFQGTFGDFSEYDLGIVIGEDARTENSALYARYKTSITGNDLETVLIVREEMVMVGGGIERAVGDMGFWAEIAYAVSDVGDNYTRASIGLDRAFGDNVLGMIEYHYSEAGSTDPDNYLSLLGTAPLMTGGVYLLGQNYLIPAVNWTATPLLSVTASTFVNLNDGSAFVRVGGEYSLLDNLYTDFGIFAGLGDGASVSLVPPVIDVGSEFGTFPVTAYVSLRFYF